MLEGGTKDEIRTFEALFKDVSTRFGLLIIINLSKIRISSFVPSSKTFVWSVPPKSSFGEHNVTCAHQTIASFGPSFGQSMMIHHDDDITVRFSRDTPGRESMTSPDDMIA